MRNLLKVMATFMKKFKRKRRVSTELHSRWGDVSITYPTQGSWNQCNQPAGSVAHTPTMANAHYEENQQYTPAGALRQASPSALSRRSRSTGARENQTESSPAFPTGYFDQNIRHRVGDRADSQPPPFQGLGIGDLRGGPSRRPSSSIVDDDCSSDDSCNEDEDEGRDTLGPRVRLSPHDYGMGDMSYIPHENTEDFDIPAKSPPLSVTSRMRRCSLQSCTTEPAASITGGTSSRRTSLTASSSISAPSMPPSTPRFIHSTPKPAVFPEKRYPPRVKHREPESAPPQELVPSYDELYG
ncbi:hypothetical protein N7475_002851 [Penicillium sp. IBT 31633x]|nr:hypothetical protein N7475_002851 [Penicillium sp. IBT 31633x]